MRLGLRFRPDEIHGVDILLGDGITRLRAFVVWRVRLEGGRRLLEWLSGLLMKYLRLRLMGIEPRK